jgi:hypothetical protein
LPIIPGTYGRIEHYDGTALAVFTDRRRLHARVLAVASTEARQRGDDELRAVFSASALSGVAAVVKSRRKYRPSTAQLRNLALTGARFGAQKEITR